MGGKETGGRGETTTGGGERKDILYVEIHKESTKIVPELIN